MKTKSKTGRPAPARASSSKSSPTRDSSLALDGRRPLVPALIWLGVMALSLILTGLPRFDALWLVFAIASLLIIAIELAFLHFIYREGRSSLYLPWKKFTGYCLPVFYFIHAFPRVTWEKAGLIDQGRATFIFTLTLIATLCGGLVFFLASRPKALVALGLIEADEIGNPALRKRRAKERQGAGRRRNFLFAILEWVDALAWAAIAVLIVNIFIFQLYVVPSESMVPAFLVGDRPFTLKLASGPRIPLTEWRLPFLGLPQRGDIVTIANPRYEENHGVDLKKYLSQLVYMLSFTTVNLDATLPDGTPKADPLVKRIVGVPGDRLMMVDDQLYIWKKGEAGWSAAKEPWARVDLWKEGQALRSKIQQMPMDEKTRAFLTDLDASVARLDAVELAKGITASLSSIEASMARIGPAGIAGFLARELPRAPAEAAKRRDEAIASSSRGENPLSTSGADADDFSLALAIAGDARTHDSLRSYVRGAIDAAALPPANAYEKGSRNLSLFIKSNLLRRLDRDLALVAAGSRIEAFGADPVLTASRSEAQRLYYYLYHYDSRNFPAFPSNESFLGPTQYFAMGDNRYNSLDFRFREAFPRTRALDAADPAPVLYSSLLQPFALEREFIEGKALFRLWPFTRFGKIE